jgi:predicted esterase
MRCLVLLACFSWGCGSSVDSSSAGGGGATGSASSSGNVTGSQASTGSGAPIAPDPKFMPKSSGSCPALADGKVSFSPHGIAARSVELWVGPAGKNGPIVFFWHGTGGSPKEATYALGQAAIDAIKAQGGVVAAPYHDPAAGSFPWFLTTGAGKEDDLLVADEVIACAIDKHGIDPRRIHSAGFSAGAMHTAQMSYRRSGVMASVITFSGGKYGDPPDQDPMSKVAAMIVHGGAKDQVVVSFQSISEAYRDDFKSKGRFTFICDHGKGHTVPQDIVPSAWKFFQDHPFGATPSPYAMALPASFPKYCAL